jgi:GrpB-like predicted nucleotidyltransferase (UPF0157 family)
MPTPDEITRHRADDLPPGLTAWVDGAQPRTGIEVVEPDPRWSEDYEVLAARIHEALWERILDLEHVGSTAVPGLPAKPIIDLALTVADSADELKWLPPLEAAGFVLVVREPWWHEHRCLRSESPAANLHVFSPDCPEVIRMRLFRDWLREHPEDVALYGDAKLRAADEANAAGEHVMQYNARKQSVVREIYGRAFRAAGLL